MISKSVLIDLYTKQKLSVSGIATSLECSQSKVNYWLATHKIPKRSISDALYQKWNPSGDPFLIHKPGSIREAVSYGIGIGLYWGEGTKSNKGSIRLGNTDPRMIKKFIDFLVTFYGIDRKRLRFGLQIFGDMDEKRAVHFWTRTLNVPRSQFHEKIIVTPHRGIGNYRKKTQYGVVTVYFNNRKLRDIICGAIDEESLQ